jgi:uncharacterized protein (TIGR00255 family)
MTVRSMTGFAQVRGRVSEELGFALSLKSVNHRFLDLHLRMPPDTDELEMKLRRRLKERLVRGHVDLTLALEHSGVKGVSIDDSVVLGYVEAFRRLARAAGLSAEPDLNAVLGLPGVLQSQGNGDIGAQLDPSVSAKLDEAIDKLSAMQAEEGRSIAQELGDRLQRMQQAARELEGFRETVVGALLEKIRTRMQELLGAQADPDRILQEAALLADRSDIQEELVRLRTHTEHFAGLLRTGGEIGKKLDFLLQEMNREANTLVAKTGGVAGEGMRITELGLAMKSEIEKLREQVQNLE